MRCLLPIFTVIFFYSTIHSLPNLALLDPSEITVVATRELKNCFICFVVIKRKMYLIKQKKENKIFSTAKEALAAYIAKPLNIAHQVDIIPAHVDYPGKVIPDRPATIHSVVPGTVAHKYGRLKLKQFWKPFMTDEERGLTKVIIKDMTRHIELAIIVALDTLIGNTDRHSSNLIYDKTDDSFYAIDMDDTFNKDLCCFNYQKFIFFLQDADHYFTRQEIEALLIYKDTLKKLLQAYTADHIQRKFSYFVKKSGIVPEGKPLPRNIAGKILFFKGMIAQSWASAYNLVELIERIILSHRLT